MNVVFLSNYYNHHQAAVSQSLYRQTEGNYRFIATGEMRAERRALGYGQWEIPQFVMNTYTGEEERQHCEEWIDGADVVITGSAPESLLKRRIRSGGLVLRYSERPLKHGPQWGKFLPRLIRWRMRNPWGKPIYMLCASAYTAGDYGRFGLFRKRTYQWGYFPETKYYEDISRLICQKNPQKLLWVGRLLDWKHPDDAVKLAVCLRDLGYRFELEIIGTGPMEQQLRQMVKEQQLEQYVHLLGAMKPEQVRSHMECAGIFLFTSDKQEGWGAVLNESMNSACAVVASHAIGAVPYLIKNKENGIIYRSGHVAGMVETVKDLLDSPQEQAALGQKAYETITGLWNAEVAAQRVMELSAHILAGEKYPDLYESGPCSRAKIITDDWM